MTRETAALLDIFEQMPIEEKQAFAHEILRRSLPFDSGPLSDEEIDAASDTLFRYLDEDADTSTR